MFFKNYSQRLVSAIFFFAGLLTQKLQTEDEVHIHYYLDFDSIYFPLLVIHGMTNVYLAASLCIIAYTSIKN